MKESIMYCHKMKRERNKELGEFWYGDCMNHPKVTKLYDESLPIHELRVREVQGDEKSTYWAWWDNIDNEFTMMHYHRDLLEMCFPYGLKAEAESGKGQDYNVTIDELAIIDPRTL